MQMFWYLFPADDIDWGYGSSAFVGWYDNDYGQDQLAEILQGPQPPRSQQELDEIPF